MGQRPMVPLGSPHALWERLEHGRAGRVVAAVVVRDNEAQLRQSPFHRPALRAAPVNLPLPPQRLGANFGMALHWRRRLKPAANNGTAASPAWNRILRAGHRPDLQAPPRLPGDGGVPAAQPVPAGCPRRGLRRPAQAAGGVPALSAFQPRQRHAVLDGRHATADDPDCGGRRARAPAAAAHGGGADRCADRGSSGPRAGRRSGPGTLGGVGKETVRCATGDEPLREVGRRWPERATIAVAFAKGHCGTKAVRPRGCMTNETKRCGWRHAKQ